MAEILDDLMPTGSQMICMGTRNKFESNSFRQHLTDPTIVVKSLDIAPRAKADFTMSFNQLPEDWDEKWDVIYSNSIDHAVDATETFYEWLRVLKPGGVLVLRTKEVNEDTLSSSDCCAFQDEHTLQFIDLCASVELLLYESIEGQSHFFIRKLVTSEGIEPSSPG